MSSYLLAALHVVLATAVSSHIVLTKSDVRSAIGWTGLVWLTPVIGSLLYLFLGINLIRRTAGRMRHARTGFTAERRALRRDALAGVSLVAPVWRPLATLTAQVSAEPLTEGNRIELLEDGDQAYPAMLAAIESAGTSIAFATYIFDRGKVAASFVEALGRAVTRGVTVRVLIDGVGARYSRPSMVAELRRRGITVAEFLPSRLIFVNRYFNLRNHRKILVIDGHLGFTGGMNVRDACVLADRPRAATRDVHFRVEGPVVAQMMDAFAFDWRFATDEELAGTAWFPDLVPRGDVLSRGIADGPDETNDSLLLVLQGALSEARHRVWIVTPYFLPEPPLLDALRVAALRGVDIRILVPRRGNLPVVTWAMQKQFGRVLEGGCKVGLTPAPFDHSKLMVVDDHWSLIGSANWDPRSLRLNFEYVVESWSTPFAAQLTELITRKAAEAEWITARELAQRSLAVRLRDGAAWLAQPYL